MALTKATQNVISTNICTTDTAQVIAGSKTFSSNVIGNVTGNVTGNLIGNVTGNINGNISGNASSATALATGSTTARTLANRFADVVNVEDFGAVGDGNVDDTNFIQAAVTFCNTHNASLYWPVGTYKTIASITNFWDIKHEGDGFIARGTDNWYI